MPIRSLVSSLLVVMLALCLLSCSALNPLCNSSRPVPTISTVSPATATVAQVQATLVLTVTGTNIVASSVIWLNGTPLATTVLSPTQLQATISATQISAAGTSQVLIHTPSNLAGNVGCDSGGNSGTVTFTVT